MSSARGVLAVLFGLAHLGVLVAPAVVLAAAADKGGVPDRDGGVLLAASVVIGLLSAAVAARQLGSGGRRDVRDVVIAAVDAVVVLAVGATGLLFLGLGAYEPAAPVLVNRGWPVVATWVLVQLAAVGLAEATRSAVARWLDREPRPGRPTRSP